MMTTSREEERRQRLREAARRVFVEYNVGGGRKKPVKSKTKAVEIINQTTFYLDSACSVCGNPIERTGKRGRPPTKCLEHRS